VSIVVEDGSAIANAESYAAVSDADTYHGNMNAPAWAAAATPAKEAALRAATSFIDGHYGARFPGWKRTKDQALLWPRSAAVDASGWSIESTGAAAIPPALKRAVSHLAAVALTTTLAPDVDRGGRIKSKNVNAGQGAVAVSTEYETGAPVGTTYRTVDLLLAPLLGLPGSGGMQTVELVRA
jgi:hypothetical protein